MQTFPALSTQRLLLREIDENDIDALFYMRSDPEVMKFIPRPMAVFREDAEDLVKLFTENYLKNESLNWGITLKNDDRLIGVIGFPRIYLQHQYAELGYLLDSRFHRQGIMTESIAAVLQYGFETMKLHRIEAITDPKNTGSREVLKHSGFKEEGILRENFLFQGTYLDGVYYSLLDREYTGHG